ncbi:MAG: hypothetical protein ACQEVT_18270 [Pseudomonadota bacterium]
MWQDRLTLPAYRVGEAASYTGISSQQISYWEKSGGSHKALSGRAGGSGISYLQLIEISVVATMRAAGLKLQKIRDARTYFSRALDLDFPFAQAKFKTDGAEILQDIEGRDGKVLKDKLLSASANGQIVWTEMLQGRFHQFDYSENGLVIRFYPRDADRRVIIDPTLSLGTPSVSGIPTWIIKNRWSSGENIADISDDFELDSDDIVSALKFEGLEIDYSRPSFAA